jgi:hypothetical protein
MHTSEKTSHLFVLALLVASYLLISPARVCAQTPPADSEKVTQLFSDAKLEAHELELDAQHMETFARSDLSWETHAVKINEIRNHVNNCGRLLTKLHDARESASPWQQKAIDEIASLLRELAANTTSATEHVNNNKDRVHVNAANYEAYLVENYAVAKELAALITDYVDYGEHKAKFERLGEKLVAAQR